MIDHGAVADLYEKNANQNLCQIVGDASQGMPVTDIKVISDGVTAQALLAISHRLAHLTEVLEKR